MAEIQNCIIKFKCTKTWESLAESGNANKRYCSECKQDVYACRTDSDIARHIKLSNCIAIFNQTQDKLFVGELSTPYKK
ncbi:MAG: hypothetical protein R3273_01660 [Pseudidiomarina maritima]|nr:hypothetical protein [Pseudidiomarina maritima]